MKYKLPRFWFTMKIITIIQRRSFLKDAFRSSCLVSKSVKILLLLFVFLSIGMNFLFVLESFDSSSLSTQSRNNENEIPWPINIENKLNFENLTKNLKIEVLSSQNIVSVTIDGTKIYEEREKRGIHVIVLNQGTGSVMSIRVFDTYSSHEDESLIHYLSNISNGRIVILTLRDEGTYSLTKYAREKLSQFGSSKIHSLRWRDMWCCILSKGSENHGEISSQSSSFNTWGSPVLLVSSISLSPDNEYHCTQWTLNEENIRRREFCKKVEGYGSLCDCSHPSPLRLPSLEPVSDSLINSSIMKNIPVIIIASNRPHYLYRMLRSLLSAVGAVPEMITVYINGFYDEAYAVTQLFGLRAIQNAPLGVKNARISQHYKISLSSTFNSFPTAEYAILVEEDLDVSSDFFTYFSQTLRLLDEDSSLYCISAWNDQGYEHTSGNSSLLYRVETMPGLGWILKRSLFKNELENRWPASDKQWDWDMWMRTNEIRQSRECLIPDVSRTFHFGTAGLNVNSHFQDSYFKTHAVNTEKNVVFSNVDSMKQKSYEKDLHKMISESFVLKDVSPCNISYFDVEVNNSWNSNVLFISMKDERDFNTWLLVAKCLHIWDLDARGFHRGLWRLFYKMKPLFIVGVPFSDYSKYKPHDVIPIYYEKKPKT